MPTFTSRILLGLTTAQGAFLPLPKGEDRGEGQAYFRTSYNIDGNALAAPSSTAYFRQISFAIMLFNPTGLVPTDSPELLALTGGTFFQGYLSRPQN
jgi:hypothetical protein